MTEQTKIVSGPRGQPIGTVAFKIGDERIYWESEVVRPGAPMYRIDCCRSAPRAQHPKVREQAHAAQDASGDDQHRKADKQRCGVASQALTPDGEARL